MHSLGGSKSGNQELREAVMMNMTFITNTLLTMIGFWFVQKWS